MQMANSKSAPSPVIAEFVEVKSDNNGGRIKVKKKTLQAMLEQFQRALESIDNLSGIDGDDDKVNGYDVHEEKRGEGLSSPTGRETDELSDLVKSRIECPEFLRKLQSVHGSLPQTIPEEVNSWDMVGYNDLFENGNMSPDQEDFVVVRQEDIVDGIACFMATYLLSLEETKDLNPSQLQEVMRKTFSVNREKGKLMRAWDGTKVIYNMASWGATAIGIYQNPAIITVANSAFWTSCRLISKLF